MKPITAELQKKGFLRTPSIIRAFEEVDREAFVRHESLADAILNQPLPIGYGQTISQPLTVAFMLELLQPQPKHRVLDVGFGSGWTSALLAEIVGKEGKVYAIERIVQLKQFGAENLRRTGYTSVVTFVGDGSQGLPDQAPFDRIHVAAAAADVPAQLVDQLVSGGRLVIPIGPYVQDVVLIEKQRRGSYREQRYPGFQFVPLVTD